MNKPHQLGVTDGQMAPMPSSPNAVSSQALTDDKKVAPLPMLASLEETKQRIHECLQQMGNNSIKSETDDYLHTVFVSRFFRFKDDVEFYLDSESQQVHFRSASRLGYSDLGANRKRYEAFKSLYD